MKYPERLSPERLFFLSKEERKIYESEWGNKPAQNQVPESKQTAEPMMDSELSESIDDIYKSIFKDVMNESGYEDFRRLLDEELKANKELYGDSEAVNEAIGAEGVDHYKWLQGTNISGIGKLFVVGLGMLGSAIALLATAIRDKLAMIKLKAYFNKMVEIIDQGRHKKRSWLSKMFNWKYRGEHNTACLRFIQEAEDRNMALSVMEAAKKLGYFAPGQMANIASGSIPQDGGGLGAFNQNVIMKLNFLIPEGPDIKIPRIDNQEETA